MNQSFGIPDGLARNNTELYGQAGVDWLTRLPALLADCSERWSLTIGPPFPMSAYSYAAPATRNDGTAIVIKARFPNHESRNEVEALRWYEGRGAVQLLDSDLDLGILLLERLEPGTMLSTIESDEQATSIAASVMKQLWRPAPLDHSFPTVAGWSQGLSKLREQFGGTSGPLPERLVSQAEGLFKELLSSPPSESVVLHGDLHHFNILSATRQPWLAIDPQGVVGDPGYEVGALLRNPIPDIAFWPNLSQILARRVDQLAEKLGFDKERILAWGIAHCVLSAWWDIEGHSNGWEAAIAVGETLSLI